MIFKRNESFRFQFGEPLDAYFVLLLDGEPIDMERTRTACKVLDVSPSGMKIICEANLNEYNNQLVQLEIHFVLDVVDIKAIGEIVWQKPFGLRYQYGVNFPEQSGLEELIISELKARRKREVANAKKK